MKEEPSNFIEVYAIKDVKASSESDDALNEILSLARLKRPAPHAADRKHISEMREDLAGDNSGNGLAAPSGLTMPTLQLLQRYIQHDTPGSGLQSNCQATPRVASLAMPVNSSASSARHTGSRSWPSLRAGLEGWALLAHRGCSFQGASLGQAA